MHRRSGSPFTSSTSTTYYCCTVLLIALLLYDKGQQGHWQAQAVCPTVFFAEAVSEQRASTINFYFTKYLYPLTLVTPVINNPIAG